MRQRLLFIVLLVVVVLVGYTILRPKPKPRAKISEKPARVTQIAKEGGVAPTPKSEPVTKVAKGPDTTPRPTAAMPPKQTEPTQKPTQPDTSKPTVTKKPDTTLVSTKLVGDTTKRAEVPKPIAQPVAEEKAEKWGTDPFIRDWVLATEIKDLRLKAVTISGMKAYALINDQILEKGEVIQGKRIVAIEKDKVILEQGGRQFTLYLGE
ncbi:MAG: hypothetical protein ABIK93_07895 [candidate division WOR-3 bacterium]